MGARDDAAFEAFVAERSGDLLRTAVLLTRDRGHAEDLLQTALVKAYRRWNRIDGDPYPYVRRILVTSAASWRRLRVTQEIVELPAHDHAAPDDTEHVAERDRMAAALATLPPRMRPCSCSVTPRTSASSPPRTSSAARCTRSAARPCVAWLACAPSWAQRGAPSATPSSRSTDMTISDLELEAGLRDLRARADLIAPAPADLAHRTRERYRAQRRARTALAAGGLVAALVVIGVPIANSTLADPQRGQAATPSGHTFTPSAPTGLLAVPTRGDLAGDDDWIAAVAALDWGPVDPSTVPTGLEIPDPPVGGRQVAFAGDVPSGRVALVLGLDGRFLGRAWFVGPPGAEPDEMSLATPPAFVDPRGFAGLVDAAGPEVPEKTLVVVSMPGDTMAWRTASVVSASGKVDSPSLDVEVEDGIGTAKISAPWQGGVDVRGNDGQRRGGYLTDSDRSRSAGPAGALPAGTRIIDPRGLAALTVRVNAEQLASSVLGQYALDPATARPTLLAAGPLGARNNQYGELYGMTHPSGATEIWLATYPAGTSAGSEVHRFSPMAAGEALLDRVVAVQAKLGLLVSAPLEGTQAQVLDRSGAVLTTIALTSGGGTGPMSDPAAATVRVLDAEGALLGEAPIVQGDP